MVKPYKGADALFLAACKLAGIENPTNRQFRKWCQKRGRAFAQKAAAVVVLAEQEKAAVA